MISNENEIKIQDSVFPEYLRELLIFMYFPKELPIKKRLYDKIISQKSTIKTTKQKSKEKTSFEEMKSNTITVDIIYKSS